MRMGDLLGFLRGLHACGAAICKKRVAECNGLLSRLWDDLV